MAADGNRFGPRNAQSNLAAHPKTQIDLGVNPSA